jgi:hypothetical protein
VKAIEDIIVKYDGTVRNAGGKVLEFLYGEDGMDAVAELESSKIDHIGIKQGELLHANALTYPAVGMAHTARASESPLILSTAQRGSRAPLGSGASLRTRRCARGCSWSSRRCR